MVKLMGKELREAVSGRRLWLRLSLDYQVDRYILMPHITSDYNDYAIDYIDAYLHKEGLHSAIFVSSNQVVLDRLSVYDGAYEVSATYMTHSQIMDMMRFYALYPFSDKVVIISLTIPYDTCGENLLGVEGINRRELFCYDIYRFDRVPQLEEGNA